MRLTDQNGWKSKLRNKGQMITQSWYNILQPLTNTIWSLYWKKEQVYKKEKNKLYIWGAQSSTSVYLRIWVQRNQSQK